MVHISETSIAPKSFIFGVFDTETVIAAKLFTVRANFFAAECIGSILARDVSDDS